MVFTSVALTLFINFTFLFCLLFLKVNSLMKALKMTCSACIHGDKLAKENDKPLKQMEMADMEALKYLMTARQRNVNWLPFLCAMTGDRPCNPGMCPDQNQTHDLSGDPSVYGMILRPTEPHQPGLLP